MHKFSNKKILQELDESNTSSANFLNVNFVDKKNTQFVSNFLPQTGGSWNKKSSKNSTDDEINQLIAMLTSDSEDKNNFTANSTQTDVLENRLKNMMQSGGSNKKRSLQKGGGIPAGHGANHNEAKQACDTLAKAGYSFNIGNKNCEEYIESNSPTSSFSNLFTSNNELNKASLPRPSNDSAVSSTLTNVRPNNRPSLTIADMRPTGGSLSPTSTAMGPTGRSLSPTSTDIRSAIRPLSATSTAMRPTGGSFSATSTDMRPTGGSLSPTSTAMRPTGGSFSATSDVRPVSGSFSATSDVRPVSGSFSVTSDVNPNNAMLSATSTTDNKNEGGNLFDVAATFITNTAKQVSKFFNDATATSEGVTSSPSGTVTATTTSVGSNTSTVNPKKTVALPTLSATSLSEVRPPMQKQLGGGKKKASKKTSKKISKKGKGKRNSKK